MVLAIGSLVAKFSATGVNQVIKKLSAFQTRFKELHKKVGPMLKDLTGGFAKFGVTAGGVIFALTRASPRLSFQFELLHFRINQFIRTFGDMLAPLIKLVTNLVEGLIKWWEDLPKPLKDAITFGVQLAGVFLLLAGAVIILQAAASPLILIILAIIAVAALLYLAWDQNWFGIRDITMAVFAAIQPLFEALIPVIQDIITILGALWTVASPVFTEIQKIVDSVIGNVIARFQNLIEIFQDVFAIVDALFRGDMKGVLEGLQNLFIDVVQGIILQVMMIPNAIRDIITNLGGTILNLMAEAGRNLINAFIEGMQRAIEGAVGLVQAILDFIAGFFGGSLPERGPLKFIDKMGRELGESYVANIGVGLASGSTRMGDTINHNLSIGRIDMTVADRDLDSSGSFLKRLNTDSRRAALW